jgi:hypothetical protein
MGRFFSKESTWVFIRTDAPTLLSSRYAVQNLPLKTSLKWNRKKYTVVHEMLNTWFYVLHLYRIDKKVQTSLFKWTWCAAQWCASDIGIKTAGKEIRLIKQ